MRVQGDIRDRQRFGHKGVSPAVEEMISFISNHKAAHGKLPTVEQLRVHMGWKIKGSARSALRENKHRIGEADVRLMLEDDLPLKKGNWARK